MFSEKRTELGINFGVKLDATRKLERRGEAIIIYMDETLVLPFAAYSAEDVVQGRGYRHRSVRTITQQRLDIHTRVLYLPHSLTPTFSHSHPLESLAIIMHVMCKEGWILDEENGVPPVVDE